MTAEESDRRAILTLRRGLELVLACETELEAASNVDVEHASQWLDDQWDSTQDNEVPPWHCAGCDGHDL